MAGGRLVARPLRCDQGFGNGGCALAMKWNAYPFVARAGWRPGGVSTLSLRRKGYGQRPAGRGEPKFSPAKTACLSMGERSIERETGPPL